MPLPPPDLPPFGNQGNIPNGPPNFGNPPGYFNGAPVLGGGTALGGGSGSATFPDYWTDPAGPTAPGGPVVQINPGSGGFNPDYPAPGAGAPPDEGDGFNPLMLSPAGALGVAAARILHRMLERHRTEANMRGGSPSPFAETPAQRAHGDRNFQMAGGTVVGRPFNPDTQYYDNTGHIQSLHSAQSFSDSLNQGAEQYGSTNIVGVGDEGYINLDRGGLFYDGPNTPGVRGNHPLSGAEAAANLRLWAATAFHPSAGPWAHRG